MADGRAQRAVTSGAEPSWRAVARWLLTLFPRAQCWAQSRSADSPVTWVKGQCPLSQFAHDTELEGAADTPAGCTAIQGELGRLESWAGMDLVKLNTGRCRVLPLAGTAPRTSTGNCWREPAEGYKDDEGPGTSAR